MYWVVNVCSVHWVVMWTIIPLCPDLLPFSLCVWLQVDSLIDVGAAAYAQLQKIKGHSLDSVENSSNRRNVSFWLDADNLHSNFMWSITYTVWTETDTLAAHVSNWWREWCSGNGISTNSTVEYWAFAWYKGQYLEHSSTYIICTSWEGYSPSITSMHCYL